MKRLERMSLNDADFDQAIRTLMAEIREHVAEEEGQMFPHMRQVFSEDELHDMARRLDDRLCSIERIMTAENPNWRQQCLPEAPRLTSTASDLDEEFARLSARTRDKEYR